MKKVLCQEYCHVCPTYGELTEMSFARLRAAASAPWARRPTFHPQRALLHYSTAGGLLRHGASTRTPRRRLWPAGAYAVHQLPAVRAISFMRVFPKLATKLVRIPAMFGATMIGGVAYLQYQAAREHSISVG